ncbi:MAG: phosphoribosyl-ATP pyrophosphohydrolase-domain containing protein (two domains) [Hyperionvirus sp.]|uniref:Phosphoribosyl-ATP pyrophosphohydrolase-domain containing protein (Two domains) n=1 Tax=Hyperionvirus sp. TaxID=2487770 RepID=A0A3G5AE11_9VIRU|nr:MAG: phosphoribosyl-ATP pyrophosphohydrolase-domain containing protein (two domains) [Hyperionvirus sp.]
MKSNYRKVLDFCRCAGHPTYDVMQLDIFARCPDRVKLRVALIREEYGELRDAVRETNFVEVIDALTDIQYVAYGAGAEFGIDLDQTFECVHRLRVMHCGRGDYSKDSEVTNYEKVRDFNNAVAVPGDIFSKPDVVERQLKLIGDQVGELERCVGDGNFIGVLISLTSIVYATYEAAVEFGIDLDGSFDIVHKSNMTKFCLDEAEAVETVEWYRKQFEESKLKYRSPAYRRSSDGVHWVVYDKDTDKALKSIKYTPAKFIC